MAALAQRMIRRQLLRDRATTISTPSNTDIDNPDQRIAEDVRQFYPRITDLGACVESVLSVIAFAACLGHFKPSYFFWRSGALIGTLIQPSLR